MKIETLQVERESILAKARALNEDSSASVMDVKGLLSQVDDIDVRIENMKRLSFMAPVVSEAEVGKPWLSGGVIKSVFRGNSAEDRDYKAYVMGQFGLHVAGRKSATKWLNDNGFIKATGESGSAQYLTPDLLSSDLQYLREQFGTARKYCKIVRMDSDVQIVPNASGSGTVYYPGENSSITASDMTFQAVTLTAKKAAALTQVSREINEDSVVDLGNTLARDFAYLLAREEDRVVFASAASGTDASGLVGIPRTLTNLASNTVANYGGIAGAVIGATGTAGAWTGFTLANIQTMIAKLPTYCDNPAFFCHKQFFYNGVADKLIALGGNNIIAIQEAYGPNPKLFGIPVVFVQVMPSVPAASACVLILGDLGKGVLFGDRRGVAVEMSTDFYFAQDALAYRATERYSVQAFDAGNYDLATPANRQAGSFVALFAAAT